MTTDKRPGSQPGQQPVLGVDTGGTFTDFVFHDGTVLHVLKLASTPAAPEQAVLAGARQLTRDAASASMVHGSTVATNALLEGKLARTAYVSNAGLADVLTIGRQARAELYNLQPAPQAPPVPRELCLEVAQRTGADGGEVSALSEDDLNDLVERLRGLRPEAVAINLLFSFRDPIAERRIEQAIIAALGAEVPVSRSSAVLPEYREYERGIATWLNAALAPRMRRYLGALQRGVKQLTIMHGAAGTVAAEQASNNAVNLLLSGPAGGLLGARFIGRLAGRERLLSFDMGGTSTDVALIDGGQKDGQKDGEKDDQNGDLRLTSEARIAGYPLAVPMVDMHTIGAGGGSIAALDAGGMLCVGPQSAGADPGPACYGQGGKQPTVTDANLVLGRLPAHSRLGGDLPLDTDAATAAVSELAESLDLSAEAAAQGIIEIANEAMAKALRVISVQRGEDAREFTLLCFGGAGGLHVCALAAALGMRRALVPVYAGVLSALGMLVARRSRQLSQSLLLSLKDARDADIEREFDALYERGAAELAAEGIEKNNLAGAKSVDLRYLGQSFSLNLPWRGSDAAAQDFHRAHEARYGHALDLPVEVVNLRLALAGPAPDIRLPELPAAQDAPTRSDSVAVHGCDKPVPVFEREQLRAGQHFEGPAIVSEKVSTTWVEPGWVCEVDRYGNLLLQRQ